MIQFDLPKQQSSIIKVIGVGGGGGNAVNYMHEQAIEGVDFVICNTDAQALAASQVPVKIQLGPNLTQGLGAGANPDIGRQAMEESMEEMRRILEVNTKMVFVTAGMGGGTGTGGAPLVAKLSREMGILTVGIVTMPFSYEGRKRLLYAREGVEQMKKYVDTLLVISNDKLRHQFGNLTVRAAFSTADNVLATAAKCITDVINSTGQINVDFADVCTVMRNGGVAILGSAVAEGEGRARAAIEQAINSPLLDDNDIRGARWILININSSEGEWEYTMDEVSIIQQHLLEATGPGTDVILGLGYNNNLGPAIGITLIATAFDHQSGAESPETASSSVAESGQKVVMSLTEKSSSANEAVGEPAAKANRLEPAEVPSPPSEQAGHELELFVSEPTESKPTESPYIAVIAPEQPEDVIFQIQDTSLPSHARIDASSEEPSLKPTTTQVPGMYGSIPVKGTERQASPASGGFLTKPSRIYAEEERPSESIDPNPVQMVERPVTEESDPNSEWRLVIKESPAADEPVATSTRIVLASAEEPAMQDEVEEQKRKAAERLQQLRNLSFNVNASDPNSEYEHVPAFIRRNLQEHQALHSPAEKFYSSITVKSDESSNQAYLSSLNAFLDGKRPD
jgi:cell division protein FtsZ